MFEPGEKIKNYWLSTDFSSKGSTGSILYTLTGDTRDVYNFTERKMSFYIYEGRKYPPVIMKEQIRGPFRNNSITVEIQTNTHCTVYFGVFPRGTLNVTFTEIKNKKLRYDNFQGKYIMGEWVEKSDTNTNFFVIPNIQQGLEQVLKIFVQNTDGVIARAINYAFSTIGDDRPMKVYV